MNPSADQWPAWLMDNPIRVLNVAGSRGSNLSTEQLDHCRQVLTGALINQATKYFD